MTDESGTTQALDLELIDRDLPDDSLLVTDYVEAVVLILACLLGLLGNLAVLNVSLKIRSFSRQISLLFCAIICADALICATRIPVTVYLILAHPPSSAHEREDVALGLQENELNVSTPVSVTTAGRVSGRPRFGDDATAVIGGFLGVDGLAGEEDEEVEESHVVDMACEVWSASGAILMTVVWLHLVVGAQRFYIIFSFSKYRKIFTQTFTTILAAAAWLLGLVFIFAPVRGFGLLMERAGRGACRPSMLTSEGVLWARGMTSAILSGLPLVITVIFYTFVVNSVLLARRVRRDALEEYNRVIVVTVARVVTLCLTYFPAVVITALDVQPGLVPDAAHRYLGYLFLAQSVISPFVTLQDNDFREKGPLPAKNGNGGVANGGGGGGRGGGGCGEERNGEGGVVVLPDLGSTVGEADEDPEARHVNRQLQRGISYISSADLATVRGSNE